MPVSPSDVLFVSKPLCPPFNDSGKLLPYLVAKHIQGIRVSVMTPRGRPLTEGTGAISEEIYPVASSFSVPMTQKLRLMYRLIGRITPPAVHFFFSPNGPTTAAARLFRALKPDVKVIQTVMSLPAQAEALRGALFGDVVVTWSRAAAELVGSVVKSGRREARVVHVPPGIEPLEPMDPVEKKKVRHDLGLPTDRPLVLYAGDLEFSSGAEVTAAAAAGIMDRTPAFFAFACRRKTDQSLAAEKRLGEDLAPLLDRGRARILDKTPVFHDLLRCADVQVLPAETTYAKTDIPLVLLEGLSAGVPAIVATGTPMQELVDGGAAVGVPPLEPQALGAALTGLLEGKGRVDALGASGRRYVLKRHTAEAMARAHAKLYAEVLRIG
ncbi:MAG: glycosyltransferase family 4 protein [Deltaproteobacteria bacterium]|nr:glycosyltransferase family 4 protein [Deltaproteobacteria bacterium]